MHRISIIIILSVLLVSCAAPDAESTPPPVIETEVLRPTDTSPVVEGSTPTTEPSPTDDLPAPTAEPTSTATPEPKGLDSWIAYISPDSNLWIKNQVSGESIAITDDAVPFQPNVTQETLTYCCARFSSDGSLLAYRRELGNVTEQLFETTYSFWVYDLSTGESRLLLDQLVMSYEWKPGEHLIAYGPEIDFDYFTDLDNRAQVANGIWALDVDSGEGYELVAPERGFALAFPRWSPNGRFLSYDEIQYMEGRGLFAYYDFESQEYIAWDEILGNYDWSPDGELLVYDTLGYISTGGERIWLRERTGEARVFSPTFDPGYASFPVFSPQGDSIAYLAALDGPEVTEYTLMVQSIEASEPRELGKFEGIYKLAWSSDGSYLVFVAGPFGERGIHQVLVEDGTTLRLTDGTEAAVQP